MTVLQVFFFLVHSKIVSLSYHALRACHTDDSNANSILQFVKVPWFFIHSVANKLYSVSVFGKRLNSHKLLYIVLNSNSLLEAIAQKQKL